METDESTPHLTPYLWSPGDAFQDGRLIASFYIDNGDGHGNEAWCVVREGGVVERGGGTYDMEEGHTTGEEGDMEEGHTTGEEGAMEEGHTTGEEGDMEDEHTTGNWLVSRTPTHNFEFYNRLVEPYNQHTHLVYATCLSHFTP